MYKYQRVHFKSNNKNVVVASINVVETCVIFEECVVTIEKELIER